ncbi:MAG: hypothetical protein COA42_17150 [Alteromonadaceae bacterium]|nr:MAG: hypothetical protein COA42_17150 [Alteromonadaceae bacterium]
MNRPSLVSSPEDGSDNRADGNTGDKPCKKYVFIGFGDIARGCAETLVAQGQQVFGIARSDKNAIDGVTLWRGAVRDAHILKALTEHDFDVAVITLTPDADARDEQGYTDTYVNNVQALIDVWQHDDNPAPKCILFVSSSSVYAQRDGEWVDESSATDPLRYNGKVLVQTEDLLLQSGLNTSVVRFSGIYGPGRDHLLKQVLKGIPGGSGFTNRIHIDDCRGVLLHLMARAEHKALQNIYLATDCTPVASRDVREWLAQQLNCDLNAEDTTGGAVKRGGVGSKRCRNIRLLYSGYCFTYPSYQQGYAAQIQTLLADLAKKKSLDN